MAKYGTIVMLYDLTDSKLKKAHKVLKGHNIPFFSKENTLYFKSLSKRNRDEISKEMNDADLTFVLFHNNNPHGDKIKEGNLTRSEREVIKRFIIKD